MLETNRVFKSNQKCTEMKKSGQVNGTKGTGIQ